MVHEAFGSDGEAGSGSDNEAGNGSNKKRKRIMAGSDSEDEDTNKEKTNEEASEDAPKPAEGEEGASGEAQPGAVLPEDSDSDEGIADGVGHFGSGQSVPEMSDFDMMMELQKAQRRRRKKKDIDLINDNDDAIAKMIADMRLAAREDRDKNAQKIPATKKISMLPIVMQQLRKADLQAAFVEANVLSVLTDWLAPMPDKSLPTIQIRKSILKLLFQLRVDDHSRLKESGIGKAVMYLYKHPRELKEHKIIAGKIINAWARPIFNLQTDYKNSTKEDRQEKDAHSASAGKKSYTNPREASTENVEEGLRPGDQGWCYRARVPQSASVCYVNRPKWGSDVDMSHKKKREHGRLDKYMKQEDPNKKHKIKTKRAVEISIEGRKMAL